MLTVPAWESFSNHLSTDQETTLHNPGKMWNLGKAKRNWCLIIHFYSLSLNKGYESTLQKEDFFTPRKRKKRKNLLLSLKILRSQIKH